MTYHGKVLLVVTTLFVIVWLHIIDYTINVPGPDHTMLRTSENGNSIPTIYVVTPTHQRLEQKADLTRLSYALRLVTSLHWIIVEDSKNKTVLVTTFLNMSKLSYTHLNVRTPEHQQRKWHESRNAHARGIAQRNAGISWIRENVRTPGVVYFADDDNSYDIRLFEEMRYTKKVSVWPVGFAGGLKYESPVCKDGKVTGWLVAYAPTRTFATDMAGFAVNVQLIHNHPSAMFRDVNGLLEPDFISQLHVNLADLEPKANNCTQRQTEQTIIRRLLQELSDVGLLCLQMQ